MKIMIDAADKPDDMPNHTFFTHCPDCGRKLKDDFGLAGGGFGPYRYCTKHGIVCKTVLPADGDD